MKEKEFIIRKLRNKIDELKASKIENDRYVEKINTLFQVGVIDEWGSLIWNNDQ